MRIESQRRLSRGLASVARSRVNDEKEEERKKEMTTKQRKTAYILLYVFLFRASKQASGT
jgi:FtsZ-interacting cell division protein ZipA